MCRCFDVLIKLSGVSMELHPHPEMRRSLQLLYMSWGICTATTWNDPPCTCFKSHISLPLPSPFGSRNLPLAAGIPLGRGASAPPPDWTALPLPNYFPANPEERVPSIFWETGQDLQVVPAHSHREELLMRVAPAFSTWSHYDVRVPPPFRYSPSLPPRKPPMSTTWMTPAYSHFFSCR